MMVSCSCGQVECEATGAPIVTVACYCDDCQEGSRQIEELPNAPRVRDADGGTAYVLYRKDRLKCSRGRDLLRDLRIREKSATRRVVASCCNSALYLDFEKGHWLSIYRARLGGVLPPLQMRIQTRFIPNKSHSLNDVLGVPRFSLQVYCEAFHRANSDAATGVTGGSHTEVQVSNNLYSVNPCNRCRDTDRADRYAGDPDGRSVR